MPNMPPPPQAQMQGLPGARGVQGAPETEVKKGGRGKQTGNSCFTVDIGVNSTSAAVYTEDNMGITNVTMSGKKSLAATVECNPQMEAIIASNNTKDIVVGSTLSSSDGNEHCRPMTNPQATGTCSSALLAAWRGASGLTPQSQKTKKGKKKEKLPGVTLVLPNHFGMAERLAVMDTVPKAGLSLANVFSAGLAAVAGTLWDEMYGPGKEHTKRDASGSASLKKTVRAGQERGDPFVFFLDVNDHGCDFACIKCEDATPEGKVACGFLMPSTRLVTVGLGGMTFASLHDRGEKKNSLKTAFKDFWDSCASYTDRIVAYVIPDDVPNAWQKELRDLVTSSCGQEVTCRRRNISIGGACLSAGELSSSKFYATKDDGTWVLEHMLPVGEDMLRFDVILREKAQDGSTEDIEIASAGARLGKPDTGAVSSVENNAVEVIKKSFTFKGGNATTDAGKLPSLTVVERRGHHAETSVKICHPLYLGTDGGSDENEGSVCESCTVDVLTDSRTGVVRFVLKQGDDMRSRNEKESKARNDCYMYVLVLLAIISLIGGYVIYVRSEAARLRTLNKEWVTNFYREHAPDEIEKADAAFEKYEQKMFILWRKLAKKYDLEDLQPPPTIRDEL